MSAPRIEIVVDELVLRGVPDAQAGAVAAALRAELGVLGERWAAASAPPAFVARDESFRRARPVSVAAGAPAQLGGAVAGAVFDGLAGGRR
jgi:hypothetical protein